MTAFDEAVLRNMGDEALGILTACWYSAEIDNPINRKFAPAFRAEAKYDPGFYAAATYVERRGASRRRWKRSRARSRTSRRS